jgi:Asp-tRNA(Asn)/Glu-tRNA(Gln) amidotransferase A subunit family amidase
MMGSYGRVSRYGLIAFASSLDRIGPFANSVRDVAAILQVIAGRDPHDSTSTTAPVPAYAAEIEKPVKGLRLGIPKDYFGEGMDAGVRKKIEAGIEVYKKLGCELIEIRMPHTDYAAALMTTGFPPLARRAAYPRPRCEETVSTPTSCAMLVRRTLQHTATARPSTVSANIG